MGHLSTESLARLVSEAAAPEENEHLEACSLCRGELKALKQQTDAMGALPDLRPPAGDWEALEARLASDGLIRSSGLNSRASRWRTSGWFQVAAALVLFLGGTALGTQARESDGLGSPAQGGPPSGLELTPVGAQFQPVSNLADALEAVNVSEQHYMLALLQYRQILDAQGETSYVGNPTARLAAIEAILAASRAAIQQAPADPYVNGVMVNALAERESFLRNASMTLGDGVF